MRRIRATLFVRSVVSIVCAWNFCRLNLSSCQDMQPTIPIHVAPPSAGIDTPPPPQQAGHVGADAPSGSCGGAVGGAGCGWGDAEVRAPPRPGEALWLGELFDGRDAGRALQAESESADEWVGGDVCEEFGYEKREGGEGAAVRLFDTFTFFQEFDMLEVRLHELAPVVHRFVVVEALRTHSGHPKALDLWRQRSRFREYWDKMVFVTAELHDDEATACANPAEANCKHWVRERSQRDQIMTGLRAAGAQPHDIVMVSDLDELLPRRAAAALRHCRTPLPITFASELFYYSFRWRITHASGQPFLWYHPQAAAMWQMEHGDMSASKLRSYGSDLALFRRVVGWHCTYFGGTAAIRNKLSAYTHQEMNVEEVTDATHIARCMREGRTLSALNRLNNATLHDGAQPALQALTEPAEQPSWALRRPLLYLSRPELFEHEAQDPDVLDGIDGGDEEEVYGDRACLGCSEALWLPERR